MKAFGLTYRMWSMTLKNDVSALPIEAFQKVQALGHQIFYCY